MRVAEIVARRKRSETHVKPQRADTEAHEHPDVRARRRRKPKPRPFNDPKPKELSCDQLDAWRLPPTVLRLQCST